MANVLCGVEFKDRRHFIKPTSNRCSAELADYLIGIVSFNPEAYTIHLVTDNVVSIIKNVGGDRDMSVQTRVPRPPQNIFYIDLRRDARGVKLQNESQPQHLRLEIHTHRKHARSSDTKETLWRG
jgi:hypothetical protein